MAQPVHTTIKAALLVAFVLALAACGKQEEPPTATPFPTGNDKVLTVAECEKLPDPKPRDDSAAGRATAVSEGVAARAACKKTAEAAQDKPNADLARIREIKEKEQAEQAARKVTEAEWKKGIKEGGAKPVKEYKY